jgi:hypothetical protein
LPQSNSVPNMNPQWQGMQNSPRSMSPEHQSAVSNVWNQASAASNKKPNLFTTLFNRPDPGSGVVIQPPPLGAQQNRGPAPDFYAARNQPNSSVLNVWNRAANTAQSGPPGRSNTPWNQMSSPPPPMNPAWNQMSSPPPPMNPAWNQMSRSPPPPPPPPPMNSAPVNVWNRAANTAQSGPPGRSNLPWNRMSSPPPPMNSAPANVWNRAASSAQYGPPGASNLDWNRMSSPQQSYYAPGPPVNSTWNQMR